MKRLASLLLCLCIPLAWAGGTAAPKIDIGKGGQCVEDTQWMRKNHMNVLKHRAPTVFALPAMLMRQ